MTVGQAFLPVFSNRVRQDLQDEQDYKCWRLSARIFSFILSILTIVSRL